MSEEAVQPRTAAEIEAELQRARERLATNLEGLVSEVHPAAVVNRTVGKAKAAVQDVQEKATAAFAAAKEKATDALGSARAKVDEAGSAGAGDDVMARCRAKCQARWAQAKAALLDENGRLSDSGKKSLVAVGGAVVLGLVTVAIRRGRR